MRERRAAKEIRIVLDIPCGLGNVGLHMKRPTEFGLELRALRRQRGWSVRALAGKSSVSSVWITLVENGHRSIGLQAIDRLAAGLGLPEPELTRFRLLGLAASERSDLLKASRAYGPTLNNALALHLGQRGIQPQEILAAISQPAVGDADLVRLLTALEASARGYRTDPRQAETTAGPFLEIRFKDGRRAWCALLVAAPQRNEPRFSAAASAAPKQPRPLTRATGNRKTTSTPPHDRTKHTNHHQPTGAH